MSGRLPSWTEQGALNFLRIVAGFLFWAHGAQKLLGVLGRDAPVEFFTLMGLAGLLEFAGGILLVLGLFTRPVAFILSGQMAWAYFSVHAPQGFWPIQNGGELAALYSFLFLYIAARGGGGFSLDGIIKLRKAKTGKAGTLEGAGEGAGERPKVSAPAPGNDIPELTEEDLAEDPEVAELLKDHRKE